MQNKGKIFCLLNRKLTGISVGNLGGDEQNGKPPAQSSTIPTKRLHYWKPFHLNSTMLLNLNFFFFCCISVCLTLLQFIHKVFFSEILLFLHYNTENGKYISVECKRTKLSMRFLWFGIFSLWCTFNFWSNSLLFFVKSFISGFLKII